MDRGHLEGHLAEWAEHIETLGWAALILDQEWRLAWVSPEMIEFQRVPAEVDRGVGRHIAEAFMMDVWRNTVTVESSIEAFGMLGPFLIADLERRGLSPADVLDEPFRSLLSEVKPVPIPYVFSGRFDYLDPRADTELPQYAVNFCCVRIQDDTGQPVGLIMFMFMDVRPNLISLLGRGDKQMYERMARLVEPGPQQASILFCDLADSTSLSRELSSSAYFKLIRRLWTGIDAVIAGHTGIVGKHAGDGASAFFLVQDLGSPSAAAAACLRAAQAIHQESQTAFASLLGSECRMKVGVHWGSSLYMGQLVPGGRLDVTALGDEVNEAARLQDSAAAGATLVSKQVLQQLDPGAAADLGVDMQEVRFSTLAELPDASDKAIRDAGSLAVTGFS